MIGSFVSGARALAVRWMSGDGNPLQIRSHALRRLDVRLPEPGLGAIATLPAETMAKSAQASSDIHGHWRDADLKRAISVAEAAGLANYSIEIAPDGTISLIVGSSRDAKPADGA